MGVLKKLLSLLSTRERRMLYGLFVAILLMAILEVAGIASIAPFLALVTNPDAIETNDWLRWLFVALAFESQRAFLIFVGIALLSIVTVSNAFAMCVTWALERFAWMRGYSLSRRLLGHYLAMPYVFFLGRNSAVLGKTVLTEVREVVKGVLIPAMEVLAKGMVATAIIVLLIAIDPILAVATSGVLGGVYGIIFIAVRKKLNRIGRQRVRAEGQRYQAAIEAFSGIKDIKLLGREREFRRRYSEPAARHARYTVTSHVIQKVPHYVVATLMFGGLTFIVMFLLWFRGDITDSIPIIGLYAVASHRLLPALKEIFSGLARIRVSAAALENICRDLEQDRSATIANRQQCERVELRDRIDLDGVSFRYPGAEESVLRDVTLGIKVNTSVALVGTTGAGKTTTADIILGLLEPDQGRLLVDGMEINRDNLPGWQAQLGYVAQQIYLTDDRLVCNIAFGVPEEEIDMAAVERAARMAGIHEFVVGELPHGYDTKVGERGVRLSGGERQRIGIARALYHDPAVLVLDEATSALDTVTEKSILAALENVRRKKTVIMIAHRLTTIRSCDMVCLLDRGRVIALGTYDELAQSTMQFQRMTQEMRPGGPAQEGLAAGVR